MDKVSKVASFQITIRKKVWRAEIGSREPKQSWHAPTSIVTTSRPSLTYFELLCKCFPTRITKHDSIIHSRLFFTLYNYILSFSSDVYKYLQTSIKAFSQ